MCGSCCFKLVQCCSFSPAVSPVLAFARHGSTVGWDLTPGFLSRLHSRVTLGRWCVKAGPRALTVDAWKNLDYLQLDLGTVLWSAMTAPI